MSDVREITMSEALNEALHEEMERDPTVFVVGEDIAQMGGLFQVTATPRFLTANDTQELAITANPDGLRQQIINLDFVQRVELGLGGRLHVELRGGSEVEISRRQARLFKARTGA